MREGTSMTADIEFLTIYCEICLGVTAFFAIVATLRQTLGEALTPYQYLITRYFIDVGLLTIVVCIASLGIYATVDDNALAWQALSWMLFVGSGIYQIHYLIRRMALRPRPPGSKTAIFVMLSSLVAWLNLGSVLFGIATIPVPVAAVILLVTTLTGMIAVFLIFVGSFMKVTPGESH